MTEKELGYFDVFPEYSDGIIKVKVSQNVDVESLVVPGTLVVNCEGYIPTIVSFTFVFSQGEVSIALPEIRTEKAIKDVKKQLSYSTTENMK